MAVLSKTNCDARSTADPIFNTRIAFSLNYHRLEATDPLSAAALENCAGAHAGLPEGEKSNPLYRGNRLPPSITICTVRQHLCFPLGSGDIEGLLFGRDVIVTYSRRKSRCGPFTV